MIAVGTRGPAVAALQQRLNQYAFVTPKIGVDSRYGAQTQRAVKQFQEATGLYGAGRGTGVVDDRTQQALGLSAGGWSTNETRDGRSGGAYPQPGGVSYDNALIGAAAIIAAAPAIIALGTPLAATLVPLAGFTGLFATTTGVVYAATTTEAGQQVLQKTGQFAGDVAKSGVEAFFGGLGISGPVILALGALFIFLYAAGD